MTTQFGADGIKQPTTMLTRLVTGASSVALAQVISGVGAIILVPLFLRAWGADVYGRWIALTALISYLSLLDFGGQSFIGNLLTQAYANQDELEFRRRLSEGVSLFVTIVLAIFVVFVALLMWPQLSLPGTEQTLTTDERLIILLIAMPVFMAIPGGVFVTAYRATGRLARGVMIGNVVRGFGLIAFALTLYLRLSPLSYAFVIFLQGLILTLVVIYDLTRQIPAARKIKIGLDSARLGRKHIRGSVFFWLLTLAYALNFQGIILVLAAIATPTVVTLFATQRTVVGLLAYIGNLFQAPLWPELTALHATQRQEELTSIVLLSVKTISLLSALGALVLWIALPFVYPIWTGQQLQFDPSLFGVMLVQSMLFAGWGTSGWVLLATNQHRTLAFWSLANAILTLSFAWLLGGRYGVLGVAVASLTGDIICGLMVYPRLAAQNLGIKSAQLYVSIMRPVVIVLSLAALLYVIGPIMSATENMAIAVVVLLFALWVATWVTYSKNEFDRLKSGLMSFNRFN